MDSAKLNNSADLPEYHLMVKCLNPFQVEPAKEIPVEISQLIFNQQFIYAAKCMGELMLQDAKDAVYLRTETYVFHELGYALTKVDSVSNILLLTNQYERVLKLSDRGKQWLGYTQSVFSKNNSNSDKHAA